MDQIFIAAVSLDPAPRVEEIGALVVARCLYLGRGLVTEVASPSWFKRDWEFTQPCIVSSSDNMASRGAFESSFPKIGAEVLQAGIAEEDGDGFVTQVAAQETQRRGDIGAGGETGEEALDPSQLACGRDA